MTRFNDKVVLITGAASGIGRASALRIASEGGTVVCTDLQQQALEKVAREIKQAGGEVMALTCDVTDESDVKATVW